jgi:monofunctional biosynthetic peptidoglycan transglycosylase
VGVASRKAKRRTAKRRTAKGRARKRRWIFRVAVVVAAVFAFGIALTLPLRWFDPVTTAFMLQDDSGRDRLLHDWQNWEQLGTAPALAVVAAEDQRFADHFGLDIDSIRNSIDAAQNGEPLRGASTISQQLAKNLYLWPGRSFVRKGLEAWLTLLLESSLPKKRILEIYLNVAEFGPGIYGIAAASRHYFAKPPAELQDAEVALLAAVLPNPGRFRADEPSSYVRERQSWILGHMQRLRREGWISTL